MNLNNAQLTERWAESNRQLRWKEGSPFPAGALQELSVVHFTLEPGKMLPTHFDSREELLVLLSGEAEISVGNHRIRLEAVSLTRVPAKVMHSLINVGTETVQALGIFADDHSIATFEEVLHPFGARVVRVPPQESAPKCTRE